MCIQEAKRKFVGEGIDRSSQGADGGLAEAAVAGGIGRRKIAEGDGAGSIYLFPVSPDGLSRADLRGIFEKRIPGRKTGPKGVLEGLAACNCRRQALDFGGTKGNPRLCRG